MCCSVSKYGAGEETRSLLQVKSLSPNHRLLIALRSPDEVVETGLCMGPPEKNARKLAAEFDEAFSLVRFGGKTRGIAAISPNFGGNADEFLCNPDCMADGDGFGP